MQCRLQPMKHSRPTSAAKVRDPPNSPGQYRPNTSQHHQITHALKAIKIAPTNEKSITISASAKANNFV